MKEILLKNSGLIALVSDEDYDRVSQYRWYSWTRSDMQTHYALTNVPGAYGKLWRLHRFILGVQNGGERVDHIDRNGLNCCRENLRLASASENMWNRALNRNSSTGFKGVSRRKDRYRAVIQAFGQPIHLGYFATAEEAHKAYCEAAVRYHGDFARVK